MSHFPCTTTAAAAAAALILLSVLFIASVQGAPNTTFLWYECSLVQYGPYDVYGSLVVQTLDDLAVKGADQPSYEYMTSDGYTAYGFSTCNAQLSEQDCSTCLISAERQLFSICPYSVVADLLLKDCQMSYPDSTFV